MSRMESPETDKKVVKGRVDAGLKEAFAEACKSAGVSQTEVVVGAVEDFVEEHSAGRSVSSDDGWYYPSDGSLRDLYEACWDHAGDDLRIYKRRHASAIAEQAASFQRENLESALMPLRKKGYIALGAMPADLTGEGYERRLHWHVKPPSADPRVWRYREDGPEPLPIDEEAWRSDDG